MSHQPSHTSKFVAYYRVSTSRQGASGLGLEAQQAAVRQYLNGGTWELVDEFVEVESGKKNDRPKLAAALAACRAMRATLIIAKLDRLARNVAFVSKLMEDGVEFVAVDFPKANNLTIHILAAVAQHEREMISNRTRAALQAAKARGVKLGNPNLVPGNAAAAKVAAQAKQAKAAAKAAHVLPYIQQAQKAGATSLRAIAEALTARGIPSPSGKGAWHAATVARALAAS